MSNTGNAEQEAGALSHLSVELGTISDELGMTMTTDVKANFIDVSKRVYEALRDDGYYGEYVLGEDLWKEFEEKYKNLYA